MKHSRMGIASFVISVVAWILVLVPIAVFGGSTSGTFILKLFLVFVWPVLVVINLLALVLGVRGIVQESKKKTFAILGFGFSSAFLGGVISFIPSFM